MMTQSGNRELDVVGQIVGGQVGQIWVREKGGKRLELGDLLVADESDSFLILQVFDLVYGSQIPSHNRELMAGVDLERIPVDTEIFEPELRNYTLAKVKALAKVARASGNNSYRTHKAQNKLVVEVSTPKVLPKFFGKLRLVNSKDMEFLTKEKDSFYVGNIRSGTKEIEGAEVWLPSADVFSHHVLIPATTGRGKSNLVKTVLWHLLDSQKVSTLVLDAHDEYYGRHGIGLKDHNHAPQRLVYYSADNPPAGTNRFIVNLRSIKPDHFKGIIRFNEVQEQAIRQYYSSFRDEWLIELLRDVNNVMVANVSKATRAVIIRTLKVTMGLEYDEDSDQVICYNKVFDAESKGMTTTDDIVQDIEKGRVVVLDTSRLADEAELLIGNIISSKVFERYQEHRVKGELDHKPVVTVVVEEAPRVLGEDALHDSGETVFSRIAKEGRKFKIGLTAITQLSSVIPREILANMNTKIILGNEMAQERQAIIASASQDLASDDRNIASLDKGEAIVSSIFCPFAMPIKIPLFDDVVKKRQSEETAKEKQLDGKYLGSEKEGFKRKVF